MLFSRKHPGKTKKRWVISSELSIKLRLNARASPIKKVECKAFQALFYIREGIEIITTTSFLGDDREGGIPDPIPNSEVKPFLADGTVHKSMEE